MRISLLFYFSLYYCIILMHVLPSYLLPGHLDSTCFFLALVFHLVLSCLLRLFTSTTTTTAGCTLDFPLEYLFSTLSYSNCIRISFPRWEGRIVKARKRQTGRTRHVGWTRRGSTCRQSQRRRCPSPPIFHGQFLVSVDLQIERRTTNIKWWASTSASKRLGIHSRGVGRVATRHSCRRVRKCPHLMETESLVVVADDVEMEDNQSCILPFILLFTCGFTMRSGKDAISSSILMSPTRRLRLAILT